MRNGHVNAGQLVAIEQASQLCFGECRGGIKVIMAFDMMLGKELSEEGRRFAVGNRIANETESDQNQAV